jgi:hypothetical protein
MVKMVNAVSTTMVVTVFGPDVVADRNCMALVLAECPA